VYQQPAYGFQRPQDTRPSAVDTATVLLAAIAVLLLIDLVIDVLAYIDFTESSSLGSGGTLKASYVIGFLATGTMMVVFAVLAALLRGGRYSVRILGLVAAGAVMWPGLTGMIYFVNRVIGSSRFIQWTDVADALLEFVIGIACVFVIVILASRAVSAWFHAGRGNPPAPAGPAQPYPSPPYGPAPGSPYS
jgi:hypothetical protein